MKTTSVSIESIADRLVEVLTNEQLTAEYKKAGHVSECFGWDGRGMSPLSREAFVDSFGLEAVETAAAPAPAEDAAPVAAAAAYDTAEKSLTQPEGTAYTMAKTADGAALIVDGEEIKRGAVLTVAGMGGTARDRYHVESVSRGRVQAYRIKDGYPSRVSGVWSGDYAELVEKTDPTTNEAKATA